MELSGSNIKKFLIFSQKKSFLIFQGTSYISGSNFPNSKSKKNALLKNFLYFGEIELSSPKLKKLLIFQEGTYRT